MKILELAPFSAGICGVWSRVKEEAVRLSEKGHKVVVFTSNIEKGSEKVVRGREKIEGVEIVRFPAKKLGGESFMNWDFEREAVKFKPDVIIAHCYRHLHTTKALDIGRKIDSRVILVTHAPFVKGDVTRGFVSKWAVRFYDKFKAGKVLNKFDKVVAITKWEIPILRRLGLDKDKIVYIPNGIPEEFFKQKKAKVEKKILFLGRISPIKNLEILISAIGLVKDKRIVLEIVGPGEKEYLEKLRRLIRALGLDGRVEFSPAIYDLKKKIKKIDSCSIFILPSKKEGMPQALVEAMARGKVVIASDIPASRDLIVDGKNGLLFRLGDVVGLVRCIEQGLISKKLGENARKSVERFKWNKIIKKVEGVIYDKN